jgi:hypothetical protein
VKIKAAYCGGFSYLFVFVCVDQILVPGNEEASK